MRTDWLNSVRGQVMLVPIPTVAAAEAPAEEIARRVDSLGRCITRTLKRALLKYGRERVEEIRSVLLDHAWEVSVRWRPEGGKSLSSLFFGLAGNRLVDWWRMEFGRVRVAGEEPWSRPQASGAAAEGDPDPLDQVAERESRRGDSLGRETAFLRGLRTRELLIVVARNEGLRMDEAAAWVGVSQSRASQIMQSVALKYQAFLEARQSKEE